MRSSFFQQSRETRHVESRHLEKDRTVRVPCVAFVVNVITRPKGQNEVTIECKREEQNTESLETITVSETTLMRRDRRDKHT